MIIMPEVRNSLQLIRYALLNQSSFKGRGDIFSVSILFMRLYANFFTEFLNVYKMSQTSSVEDVVKDFIAFGIISEIDVVIAGSFLQIDVAQEVSGCNITYEKLQDQKTIGEIIRTVWE
jgi:hypothetical protein